MNQRELIRQMRAAIDSRWTDKPVRCPSVKRMAELIRARWPELYVEVEPWSETKDTHPKGVRWRIPGRRTYRGFKLTVSESIKAKLCGRHIYSHTTTETYRRNTDVARWILERIEKSRKKRHAEA